LEFFARLARNEKHAMHEALVVLGVEREGPNQAGLRGRREVGANDVFSVDFGQEGFRNSVLAEEFASEGEGCAALLGRGRLARCDAEVALLRVCGEGTHLAANFE
jgi:hypothetical protein